MKPSELDVNTKKKGKLRKKDPLSDVINKGNKDDVATMDGYKQKYNYKQDGSGMSGAIYIYIWSQFKRECPTV